MNRSVVTNGATPFNFYSILFVLVHLKRLYKVSNDKFHNIFYNFFKVLSDKAEPAGVRVMYIEWPQRALRG